MQYHIISILYLQRYVNLWGMYFAKNIAVLK